MPFNRQDPSSCSSLCKYTPNKFFLRFFGLGGESDTVCEIVIMTRQIGFLFLYWYSLSIEHHNITNISPTQSTHRTTRERKIANRNF